jgi:hypothetical protein
LEKGIALSRLPVSLLTGFLIVAAAVLPGASAAASAEQDAIDQLNQVRQSNGLAQLRTSESLHRSSSRYAKHIIDTDYFGHASRIAASGRSGRDCQRVDELARAPHGAAVEQLPLGRDGDRPRTNRVEAGDRVGGARGRAPVAV